MFSWIYKSARRLEEEQRRIQDFLLEVDSGERRLRQPFKVGLHGLRLVYHAFKGFWFDDCFSKSAALAYASLCSVVPVAVLVIYALLHPNLPGELNIHAQQATTYVQEIFVPSEANEVVTYLQDLQNKLAQARDPLGFLGLGFLLIIAYSLLNTLEGVMNVIWKVQDPRFRFGRMPVYLFTLCLAAALIGLMLAVPLPPMVKAFLGLTMPYLIVGSFFFLILYLVPNTRVALFPALAVTGLATGLWFAMKWGFNIYLTHFLTYDKIFGAVGLIPVFLLWIYLTWCVLLFGAKLIYVTQHFQAVADRRFRIVVHSRFFPEYLSLRLLLALARSDRPMRIRELDREIPVPETELRRELLRLKRAGLVGYRFFKGFLLKADPKDIRLRGLLHLGKHALEQLKLVRDESAAGRFCLRLIEDMVHSSASVPGERTLADALEALAPHSPAPSDPAQPPPPEA